eukprot:234387-Chlamydomonas_euryale.AAC.1
MPAAFTGVRLSRAGGRPPTACAGRAQAGGLRQRAPVACMRSAHADVWAERSGTCLTAWMSA